MVFNASQLKLFSQALENLKLLAGFASQLPLSWYTDEFLNKTYQLAENLLTRITSPETIDMTVWNGLNAVSLLFSFWLRKSGE
jgi:hypothetical protein